MNRARKFLDSLKLDCGCYWLWSGKFILNGLGYVLDLILVFINVIMVFLISYRIHSFILRVVFVLYAIFSTVFQVFYKHFQ